MLSAYFNTFTFQKQRFRLLFVERLSNASLIRKIFRSL